MKKNLLLIALGLLAIGTQAQNFDSPWKGEVLPAEGGTYYIYNVESGLWLQHNRKVADLWTTHAQLDLHGFDFVISPIVDEEVVTEGLYQLNPRFGHNHSLNATANEGYMDTGDAVSQWLITPQNDISGFSATNMYEISAIDGAVLLGAEIGESNEDTFLSFAALDYNLWQFVSKEERMADLETATSSNPKDATWLIDDWDFANQNERASSWKNEFKSGNNVFGGDRNEDCRYNRSFESWNGSTGMFYQTITGLPNGTYHLTLQGFYRDGSTGGIGGKHSDGSEVIRAFYFANEVSAPLLSICENDVDAPIDNMFPTESNGYFLPGDGGSALPNASLSFANGYYWNPEIEVLVTDGTLKIGVKKDAGVGDDWTVFDNFKLTYLGASIDITQLLANLDALCAQVDEYAGYRPEFLEESLNNAIEALDSDDVEVISAAMSDLLAKFDLARLAGNTMLDYFATVELCKAEATAGSYLEGAMVKAQTLFDAATSASEYTDALNVLVLARKINAAEHHPNVWTVINQPEVDGMYYFYNVGQQRFFCGGGDWGTHASVGVPGIEIMLEEPLNSDKGFRFNTFRNNGYNEELDINLQYLNYGGYVDTTGDDWDIVDRGDGTVNISRTDTTLYLGYVPGTYCNVNTDMSNPDDPNNIWILVTREDRENLLTSASDSNPIDASFFIGMPNFDQRENLDESGWYLEGGSIWGRGANYDDFTYESYSAGHFDMNQTLEDLPAGKYTLSCQGYYREGVHEEQARILGEGGEPAREAVLYAYGKVVEGEQPLWNISQFADQCPGQGELAESGSYRGNYPYWVYEATRFFQTGLYWNHVDTKVEEDGALFFGVYKDYEYEGDWVVIDNFRLKYYGDGDGTGISNIADEKPADNRLFNLMGIEVANPTTGVYVRNGQKFIVR